MIVAQKQTNNAKGSTAETSQSSCQNQLAQVTNNSKDALAQRDFISSINNSPRMLAQRQRIESYRGMDSVDSNYPHRVAQRQQFQGISGKATQLKGRSYEEELLQGKFTSEAPPQLKQPVQNPNNTGLPDKLKSGIESLSGISMDNVKVHYNSSRPAQLNALAYAQGTYIHLAPGQEQHLPHEAWHLVQQAQGRVQPTMQMKNGVPVNDNKGLEHEADVMGAKAVQMKEGMHAAILQPGANTRIVQRMQTDKSTGRRRKQKQSKRPPHRVMRSKPKGTRRVRKTQQAKQSVMESQTKRARMLRGDDLKELNANLEVINSQGVDTEESEPEIAGQNPYYLLFELDLAEKQTHITITKTLPGILSTHFAGIQLPFFSLEDVIVQRLAKKDWMQFIMNGGDPKTELQRVVNRNKASQDKLKQILSGSIPDTTASEDAFNQYVTGLLGNTDMDSCLTRLETKINKERDRHIENDLEKKISAIVTVPAVQQIINNPTTFAKDSGISENTAKNWRKKIIKIAKTRIQAIENNWNAKNKCKCSKSTFVKVTSGGTSGGQRYTGDEIWNTNYIVHLSVELTGEEPFDNTLGCNVVKIKKCHVSFKIWNDVGHRYVDCYKVWWAVNSAQCTAEAPAGTGPIAGMGSKALLLAQANMPLLNCPAPAACHPNTLM